tara:strand:+ start:68 stop:388 length:321 start_codon:yes stop_codon:yes gene_type:complete
MLLEKPVFKMYVKDGCSYCDEARKIILSELKTSLHLINVTSQPDLHKLVIKDTGIKTVPVILIGKELIGGCDDLKEQRESGVIEKKILLEENDILKNEILKLRRSL